MSLQAERICIVGDSHLASVRRAIDAGLVDLDGADVEYWGAPGPAFRELRMRDGRIEARGEALKYVRRVNGRGRDVLTPDDFDIVLFYGGRLRVSQFFAAYLDWMQGAVGHVSDEALQAAAEQWLIETRAFRFARAFAATGKAEIVYVPSSFPTDSVVDYTRRGRLLTHFPRACDGTAEQRARLWQALRHRALSTDVTLVPQPEETVVNGVFTDRRYATDKAWKMRDTGHKSTEFAALMLRAALGEAPVEVKRKAA